MCSLFIRRVTWGGGRRTRTRCPPSGLEHFFVTFSPSRIFSVSLPDENPANADIPMENENIKLKN